ncbi:porin family protein [Algoriphagus machipongonensis]|uniref:Outer membrane protein beta-barrel domain-containing protein n=1 Tax=Algoriphagus machipongonensis TaxID=388413 RepID=A3I167_9BACT|nr:hypothetical protein [Algoriphagus machipongonensis]EAZ80213.1 hypothetical protein ALPR1_16329 [Algoriphagus machipongonensis]
MNKTFVVCLVIFLAGIFQLSASYAQTKVGANLLAEFSNDVNGLAAGFGLVIDHKLTPKSGIESGLYYRTYQTGGYVNVIFENGGNAIYFFDINEQYISLPILYKYHTKIVNLAIGPTLEYYVGWNQINGEPEVTVDDHSISPRFGLGMMLKVSRSIPLSSQLSLEPELRFNPILSSGKTFGGLGVALKYELK